MTAEIVGMVDGICPSSRKKGVLESILTVLRFSADHRLVLESFLLYLCPGQKDMRNQKASLTSEE